MRGLLVFIAALGTVAAHGATLYRYVNPQGMTVYQETPPPSSARQVQRIPVARPSSPHRTIATRMPVVLYLAPACPPCRKAQAYLRSRGVPFTTVNMAASAAAAQAMRAQTGVETVPTIRVGTQILVGYVRSVWADALTIAGYPRRPIH